METNHVVKTSPKYSCAMMGYTVSGSDVLTGVQVANNRNRPGLTTKYRLISQRYASPSFWYIPSFLSFHKYLLLAANRMLSQTDLCPEPKRKLHLLSSVCQPWARRDRQHRGQAAPPNCAGAPAPAALGTESTSKRTNTADIHLPVQPYSHVECLKHGTAKRFFTALIWFTGRFSKHFTHVHPQMSWVKSIPFQFICNQHKASMEPTASCIHIPAAECVLTPGST